MGHLPTDRVIPNSGICYNFNEDPAAGYSVFKYTRINIATNERMEKFVNIYSYTTFSACHKFLKLLCYWNNRQKKYFYGPK